MATQQQTIREMATKKLLNGEQRKVLYKIFERKINDRISSASSAFERELTAKEEEIKKKAKKNPTVCRLLEDRKRAQEAEKKAEEGLSELGYSISTYSDSFSVSRLHPEMSALRDEQDKKIEKMEGLRFKLLSDIYGLPMSYDEMMSYIEKEIAKVESK